jgi:hypothetical protein
MAGKGVRKCPQLIDPRFGSSRIFENIEGISGGFNINIIPQT